jgi:hypothetical protein
MDSLDALLEILRQPTSSDEDIKAAAHAFLAAVADATSPQVDAALDSLATILKADDVFRAGYAALVIGAVLEQGHDGTAITAPFIERLSQVLQVCNTFAERCRNILVERGTDDDDRAEAFTEVRAETAKTFPAEADAWDALNLFWRPGIVLFSSNIEVRQANQQLRSLTEPISEYNEGAHWLDMILSTPIDEPLLVIEPKTQQGFQGSMTGIVDNFQLHTLLMDVFPGKGWLSLRRVSRSIVDVANGSGPQQTDDEVTGVWNMYAWTAINDDLELPSTADRKSTQHWIWGEGKPADIPSFEGYRVILLGPPAYARSWPSQRMFAKLPAAIKPSKMLEKQEALAWLKKMAASSNHQM